jgi:hypothetical protein
LPIQQPQTPRYNFGEKDNKEERKTIRRRERQYGGEKDNKEERKTLIRRA